MSFLQENLDFFREYDPQLVQDRVLWEETTPYETHVNRKGDLWVEIDGLTVHSKVAPKREAQARLTKEPEHIPNIHIGLGLGYMVEAQIKILDKTGEPSPLLVFEPDKRLFRTILETRPLKVLLEGTSIRLFSELMAFYLALEQDFKNRNSFQLLVLKYHQKRFLPLIAEIRKRLGRQLQQKDFFKRSSKRLGHLFSESTLRSLDLWMKSHPFDALIQAFTEKPAIIVVPGPSLSKNIADIIPYRDRVIVIAISRVAKILEVHGIEPDFLVHVEAQDFFQFIQGCTNLSQTVFLLEEQTERKYFEFPCLTYVGYHNSQNQLGSFLTQHFPQLKRMTIPSGGSVAQVAYSSAVLMGCNPVILMGQDLALANRQMYADGSMELPENIESSLVPGYFSGMVPTAPNYERFRIWFEESAEAFKLHFKDLRLINATEGGSNIQGFERMSIRHAAHLFFNKPIDVKDTVESLFKGTRHLYPKVHRVRKLLEEMKDSLGHLIDLLDSIDLTDSDKNIIASIQSIPMAADTYFAFTNEKLHEFLSEAEGPTDLLKKIEDLKALIPRIRETLGIAEKRYS